MHNVIFRCFLRHLIKQSFLLYAINIITDPHQPWLGFDGLDSSFNDQTFATPKCKSITLKQFLMFYTKLRPQSCQLDMPNLHTYRYPIEYTSVQIHEIQGNVDQSSVYLAAWLFRLNRKCCVIARSRWLEHERLMEQITEDRRHKKTPS